MTKNEMLSLCKKACNELDDCEICPNKEKCDNISPEFNFAYLIEQAYGFSEEETIDFYNGFFPEKKVKKKTKKLMQMMWHIFPLNPQRENFLRLTEKQLNF